MSNEKDIYPKNFVVLQEVPVIDVIHGPDGVIREKFPNGISADSTGTARNTGTNTTTSRTSGTTTNAMVDLSTFPTELEGFNTQSPMSDADDDNSTDTDSDWDIVTDSDESSATGDKITGYSDKVRIVPPLSPEGTVAVLQLNKDDCK